jgi:thiol-disulfide isomerase/thioredoxin
MIARLRPALLVAGLVLAVSSCAPKAPPGPRKPEIYPAKLPVALSTLDGKPASLAPLLGERLTIVNLWATWCGPCAREMPELVKLGHKLKAQGPKGVRIVGISLDNERTGLSVYAGRMGVDYPMLFGGQPYARALGVEGIPVTLFLDAKGKLVDGIMAETDAATLEAKVRLLLGEKLDHLVP